MVGGKNGLAFVGRVEKGSLPDPATAQVFEMLRGSVGDRSWRDTHGGLADDTGQYFGGCGCEPRSAQAGSSKDGSTERRSDDRGRQPQESAVGMPGHFLRMR